LRGHGATPLSHREEQEVREEDVEEVLGLSEVHILDVESSGDGMFGPARPSAHKVSLLDLGKKLR
jgi:hypothetical protein